jgi:hypothetical protein
MFGQAIGPNPLGCSKLNVSNINASLVSKRFVLTSQIRPPTPMLLCKYMPSLTTSDSN